MNDQMMSKAQQIAFCVFATFSIPSAFMFGLGMPLGKGFVSLLDATFYASEIFRFLLAIGFVGAVVRPVLLARSYAKETFDQVDSVASSGKDWASRFISILGVSFIFLMVATRLIDVRIMPELLIFSLFISFFFTMFSLFLVGPERNTARFSNDEQLYGYLVEPWRRIGSLTYLWQNSAVLVLLLCLTLLSATYLGNFRMKSLLIGEKYCIVSGADLIDAAIVGKTDDGILFATHEVGDWDLLISEVDYQVHFLSKSFVESIHGTCKDARSIQERNQS